MDESKEFAITCPLPVLEATPRVLLAHGGGGRLMHQLLDAVLLPCFDNPWLAQRHDGAVLQAGGARLAFTTDSHVVQPLFFPGGDIGTLAVYGTVNDLAMCGARPLFLTAGFILEEGLPMEILWKVCRSMRDAAHRVGVHIVSGDTKVVEKGHGDGMFINTAGLGALEDDIDIAPRAVQPGDAVLLSGDIGRHGIAVMSARQDLTFETTIESDCAPLHEPVLALLEAKLRIRCLRDLTRGGLAAGLVEIARTAGLMLRIEEQKVPVGEEVRGACEIFGFDPLYVANEGRFIVFVAPGDADAALKILHRHPVGAGATKIGRVCERAPEGLVIVVTAIGSERILDLPSGEQLPRIC